MWWWYGIRRLKIKKRFTVENCEKFAYRSKRSAICPNAPQGQPSWILMRKRFPEIRRTNQISAKIEREFTWMNDLRKRHIYMQTRINVRNVESPRPQCEIFVAACDLRDHRESTYTCSNNFYNYTTFPRPFLRTNSLKVDSRDSDRRDGRAHVPRDWRLNKGFPIMAIKRLKARLRALWKRKE